MPAVGKKRQRKESSENSNKRQKTNSTEDNTKSTTKATRSTKNSNKQSEQPKQPTRKSSRTIKPTKKTSKQSTKPKQPTKSKQPTRKSLRTKKPVQRESFVTDESIEKLFENDMDTDDSELESEIVSEFLEKQTSHKSTQTKQVKSFNKFVDLHRNMQAAFFNMHGEQVTVDTDFLRNKNSYQSIEINEDNGTSNDGVREYHTVDSDEDTPVEDEVENSDEDVAENTNNGKTCFPDDFFQCGDGVKPKDKVMSAFLHGTGFRTKLLDHILECTNNRKSCVAEKKIQYLKDVNKGKKILIQTIKRTLTGTDANETDDETDNETVTESDSSGASMDIIGNTDTNDIDNGTVVESDSSEASMDITVAESADKADDNGNVDNNAIKKGRGRPRKQQAASPRNRTQEMNYQKHLKHHVKYLNKDFTKEQIITFIAINIYAGKERTLSIADLFRNPDKNNISTQVESIGYFSLSRMSKKDFFFLNACFSADIDFLVNLMEESISEIYKHSADLAPDETMLPSKILKNCHHMFIRGKPHPNGILCTSMADRNKIMLALRPRRRTKKDIDVDPNRRTKEDTTDQEVIEAREKDPAASTTTTELIISMTNRIQENDGDSFVVVDSLYGSYDLLTKLEEKNIGAIAKCRVDRPRAIFEPLVKIIAAQGGNSAPKVGDYATMTAKLPNGKPFTAFSIITKKKSDNKFTFAHLLSTKHLNSEIGISGVSSRMVEEKDPNQNYKEEVALKYVGVLSDYNRCSPFIDNVNDKLVNNLPTFRSTRWICKFTIFIIVIMIHNAYRLMKVKAEENNLPEEEEDIMDTIKELSKLTFKKFLGEVVLMMSPLPIHEPVYGEKFHRIERIGKQVICDFHQEYCTLSGEEYNYSTARTRKYCFGCQAAVCENCFHNFHTDYHDKIPRVLLCKATCAYIEKPKSLFLD